MSPGFLRRRRLTNDEIVGRSSAFVYGNVLILAALMALTLEDISHGHGVVVLLGTGLSTLVAHLFADAHAHRVRHGVKLTAEEWKHEFRNAVPILSATALPSVVLLLGMAGVLSELQAWVVAVGIIVARMIGQGLVIGRLEGRKPTVRDFLGGLALAAIALAIAILKVELTH